MGKASFIQRAFNGQLGVRAPGGGKKSMTGSELKAYNARFDAFANSDVKRSIQFSSVEAFNDWYGRLTGDAKERYTGWKVYEKDDGTVIVYKDLNDDGAFQPDTDQIIAVNGQRLGASHASKRRDYSTFKVKNPDAKMSKFGKAGGGGKLSGFNMVAKVVGAILSRHKIKFTTPAAYSTLSSDVYDPIRNNLIEQLRRAPFSIPVQRNAKGEDLSIAKMSKSKEFKLGVLDTLLQSPIEEIVIDLGSGRQASRPFTFTQRFSTICSDFDDAAVEICQAVGRKYGVSANGLLKGVGLDVVVVADETRGEARKQREGGTYTSSRGIRTVTIPGGSQLTPLGATSIGGV
jgi:hypothetical protein